MAKKNETKNKRERIEKTLERLEAYLLDRDKQAKKLLFLEKFSLCEVCCKAALKQYKKQQKTYVSDEKIQLHIDEIINAMAYIGVEVPESLLASIFSGSLKKKDSRSAKVLRNQILHAHNTGAIDEVARRYAQLDGEMEEFLNLFRPKGKKTQHQVLQTIVIDPLHVLQSPKR